MQNIFTYGGRLVQIKSSAFGVSGFLKLTQSIFQRFSPAQFQFPRSGHTWQILLRPVEDSARSLQIPRQLSLV